MKKAILCVLCALMLMVNTASSYAEGIYTVEKDDLSINRELSRDVQNILMLLQDSEMGTQSTTLLVASINRRTGGAVMVTLVPNTVVDMPLAGEQLLCDAYALGGVNLVMKAVNEVYGLNVSQYALIDVKNFGAIVESLGGMKMTLTEQEAQVLGLSAGEQMLDTEKTMAYMRIESDDPAQSRPYKSVMQLLYQGTRDKNPVSLMGLASNLMGAVETNLGLMDMITLATSVMGGSEREELLVPAVDALSTADFHGRAAYTADMEAAKALLYKTIYE